MGSREVGCGEREQVEAVRGTTRLGGRVRGVVGLKSWGWLGPAGARRPAWAAMVPTWCLLVPNLVPARFRPRFGHRVRRGRILPCGIPALTGGWPNLTAILTASLSATSAKWPRRSRRAPGAMIVVEVVELDGARDVPLPLGSNHFHFGNSCPGSSSPHSKMFLTCVRSGISGPTRRWISFENGSGRHFKMRRNAADHGSTASDARWRVGGRGGSMLSAGI
jgi:hypothetical protein